MNTSSENENEEFLHWYIDLIENYPNTFKHYLSKKAFLQWFGRSVTGPDKILYFIKTHMAGTRHVNFRYIKNENSGIANRSNSVEKNNKLDPCTNQNEIFSTPESNVSSVNLLEKEYLASGDGPIIDQIPQKFTTGQIISTKKLNSATTLCETIGEIQFGRPTYKKSFEDNKWTRSCTLRVEYVGNLANPLEFNIKSIIYGDKMPCKRNLLPEFDKCIEED